MIRGNRISLVCALIVATANASGAQIAATQKRLNLATTERVSNSHQSVTPSGISSLPTVTLSPSNINFGNQPIGVTSAAQAVTLSTDGPITISSIVPSYSFAQTNNCGPSLGAGGSCTIDVTFTPIGFGVQTGTLTVTDTGAGRPQTVALQGTGVDGIVTLSPVALIFPTQVVNTTSKAQNITLTNVNPLTLTISSIAATGQFNETNTCGISVAPGASCMIAVIFEPTNKGTLTGTIRVTDNAAGSPQTAALTGCGTYIEFSNTSLNFGDQAVGTESSEKELAVTNKGGSTVSITSISMTGTDPGDFAQTNSCGTSVAAGAKCSISVTFVPAKQGRRTAKISLSDDGGCSPQTVTLTGYGTP